VLDTKGTLPVQYLYRHIFPTGAEGAHRDEYTSGSSGARVGLWDRFSTELGECAGERAGERAGIPADPDHAK
jgi:hypothetical protein